MARTNKFERLPENVCWMCIDTPLWMCRRCDVPICRHKSTIWNRYCIDCIQAEKLLEKIND